MYVRKVGAAWEIFAPAKLNLYLEVLGRRGDGFHELETLMAPIRLYDLLQWRCSEADNQVGFSVAYDPSTSPGLRAAAPIDEKNLVSRAIKLLARAAGVEPTGHLTLTKRIPVQSGLGGGSSDAAAALVLANAAWKLNYSGSRLASIAAGLGSDVPFFLAGQSAVCRGRGERIEAIESLPKLEIVVVVPPVGLSTATMFSALDAQKPAWTDKIESRRKIESLVSRLTLGSLSTAAQWMTNRLQAVAASLCPWIEKLGTAFASCGCHAHLLTGSGSAYFGVMRSARHARRAVGVLRAANLGTVFASATCR
jgi:4-diphosphocytidyl-2-C-methyl-D-erythritol kinase